MGAIVINVDSPDWFRHTLTQEYAIKAGAGDLRKYVTAISDFVGDKQLAVSIFLAESGDVAPIPVLLKVSEIKGLLLCAEGGVTLHTNSLGSPIDSIVFPPLTVSAPIIWSPSSRFSCPFTQDVTMIYAIATELGAEFIMAVIMDDGFTEPDPNEYPIPSTPIVVGKL